VNGILYLRHELLDTVDGIKIVRNEPGVDLLTAEDWKRKREGHGAECSGTGRGRSCRSGSECPDTGRGRICRRVSEGKRARGARPRRFRRRFRSDRRGGNGEPGRGPAASGSGNRPERTGWSGKSRIAPGGIVRPSGNRPVAAPKRG